MNGFSLGVEIATSYPFLGVENGVGEELLKCSSNEQ